MHQDPATALLHRVWRATEVRHETLTLPPWTNPSASLQVVADLPPTSVTNGHNISAQALTNVLNCLHEPGADVSFMVILHRDTLVLVVPLKVVWAV